MGFDEVLEDGQLPRHRLPHGGAVPLPQGRAPLDIGEKKGDGAGGEIRHRPSPGCRSLLKREEVWHTVEATTLRTFTVSSSTSPWSQDQGDAIAMRSAAQGEFAARSIRRDAHA